MTKWSEWKKVGGAWVCALYYLPHCHMKQSCQMDKYPAGKYTYVYICIYVCIYVYSNNIVLSVFTNNYSKSLIADL